MKRLLLVSAVSLPKAVALTQCRNLTFKNGLLSIAALMLDYNDIVVMCLQLIPLRIVS